MYHNRKNIRYDNKGPYITNPLNLDAMKTKSRKADLERRKSIFFQIGLISALALVLTAFEWPSSGEGNFALLIDNRVAEPPIDIVILDPAKITPPPPPPVIKIAEIIRIHEDDAVDIDDGNSNIFDEPKDDIIPFILNRQEEDAVEETIPFLLIEKKPTFMGGDYNEFSKWVYSKLEYPELAAKNGIQGKVILQFIIDTKGNVTDITVLRAEDPLLAKEALRVVSMSPKWEPGLQREKPTKVIFTFPITFRLQ